MLINVSLRLEASIDPYKYNALHHMHTCTVHEEEEEEALYIRAPSPIGLIGWNIQRKLLHVRSGSVLRDIIA